MIVRFPRFQLADKQFAALASPARREILACLACGPMRADALAEYVGIGTSTICHHLNVLQAAGLARRTRWPLWAIDPDGIVSLEEFIHAFFSERVPLSRYPFRLGPARGRRCVNEDDGPPSPEEDARSDAWLSHMLLE